MTYNASDCTEARLIILGIHEIYQELTSPKHTRDKTH
jgi:hypothetical protein